VLRVQRGTYTPFPLPHCLTPQRHLWALEFAIFNTPSPFHPFPVPEPIHSDPRSSEPIRGPKIFSGDNLQLVPREFRRGRPHAKRNTPSAIYTYRHLSTPKTGSLSG